MSLFSAINQSATSLRASQLGLQVVGNNIANANTPGYIRQELELRSASSTRLGKVIVGQGVLPVGTNQVFDRALAERMWKASTAVSGAQTLEKAYNQLEDTVGGLDGEGIEKRLNDFNNSLHELANSPADRSLRESVLLQADAVAGALRQSRDEVMDLRRRWDTELKGMSHDINRLTSQIAQLNSEIISIEGGRALGSDATGLRDERYKAIGELSEYLKLNVQEEENGTVRIFVGGDYLVSESKAREVYTANGRSDIGQEIRIVETDSPLQTSEGKFGATVIARDEIFGGFTDKLDDIAMSLVRSVNEVHSQGQGRRGYETMEGTEPSDTGVPLERAGLKWTPKTGSFDLHLVDEQGELIKSHRIDVRRMGKVTDSTIQSIVADLDIVDGITATTDEKGRIQIESDGPGIRFTFSDDTSGFLAAAGLNTMLTGSDAGDIAVNPHLKNDPELLAVSRGGVGQDTNNLIELVDLIDRPAEQLKGQSVRGLYEQSLTHLAQSIKLQQGTSAGIRDFHATLESQHLAITGVNLDEEAIKMLAYQKSFQAASRVIQTANELLDLLISL
ncbi:MAG: flagellar hook-associated protein FlgK [Pirellulaceae bacterium]